LDVQLNNGKPDWGGFSSCRGVVKVNPIEGSKWLNLNKREGRSQRRKEKPEKEKEGELKPASQPFETI